MTNIAFIGLGNMGAPMAANLLQTGYRPTVYDILPEAVEKLADQGARPASTVAEAVAEADVVVTMLPASEHVRDLYLGEGQLLRHARQGALLIDCSTIAPKTAIYVAGEAIRLGFEMIDAPVSGGVAGAIAGTLTFIVGGSAASFERADPILHTMGRKIFHAGHNGAGQTAKICNNMLLAIQMTGTSEALSMGVANNLDPKVLSEILKNSSGGNWTLNAYNPYPGVMEGVPSANQYEGGFLVDLMVKDLGLAMDTAKESGSSTPLGMLATELYRNHKAAGWGRKDFSSILKAIQRN